jgi:hypothetical protein
MIHLLMLAVIFVAASVPASECLDRPADQITVIQPGRYTEEFDVSPPGDFHTYDMRGAEFTNFPPEKPVAVRDRLNGACVVGPRIVGQQPRALTWRQVKNCCDGDGVRFVIGKAASVGRVIGEGLWMDNVHDGFEPVRYSNAAGKGYSWTLRHSYFRYVRDDVVENDACLPGDVVDVLVDNSFVFISSRPGSGNDLDNGATAPIIKVYDSLIHVGSDDLGGRPWKWPGSSSTCKPTPILDVRNTVFRIDRAHSGTMDWPDGTFQKVTVVWLGGGDFPVPLPAGVRIADDVGVWKAARSEWLERHGCDANGDFCGNLLHELHKD